MTSFEGRATISCARGQIPVTVRLRSWTDAHGFYSWGGHVTSGDNMALALIMNGMGDHGLTIRLEGAREGRFIPDVTVRPGSTQVDISGTGPIPFGPEL